MIIFQIRWIECATETLTEMTLRVKEVMGQNCQEGGLVNTREVGSNKWYALNK